MGDNSTMTKGSFQAIHINHLKAKHPSLYPSDPAIKAHGLYIYIYRKRNYIRREWNVQKRMRHPRLDRKYKAKA